MATGIQFSNSSNGSQYNVSSGTQNNNSGSGSQYNAQSITFLQGAESDTTLLADLRVTDPRDDKVRIERTKGGLLRDSYCWILDHDNLIHWRGDAQGRLLWIKGDPGKGKTMLLCGIIDELEKQGSELVYFFCQATDARLNTATAVLRGLLYLLLCQRPNLIGAIREKHKHAGKQLFEDANSWDFLCMTLTGLLHDDTLESVVLVIDALDECTTGLDQLLDFIVQLSSSQTKVIVSSRNWSSIETAMEGAVQKIPICLELNEQAISGAVANYIRYKVDQLTHQKKYDDATREEVSAYLTATADNTFLWVALVSQQLADHKISRRHTRMKLKEFPPGLDALYKKMLDKVWGSIDADLCKKVLAFMSIVYRPVDLIELASLVESLECFLEDTDSLEEIVRECGSLLTVRGGIVYFVHQSAKDFLLQNALDRIMPSGIKHEHSLLLSKSLRLMSNTLRRNIYNLEDPGASVDDSCVPVPNPLAPARYSCIYWIEHLVSGEPTGEQWHSQVYNFLASHYLHWLEALSLLRSIPEGLGRMFKLLRAVQVSEGSSPLDHLVYDALRFMRYHYVGIEISPLQVYSSALIFSPTDSTVRRLFIQRELVKWIVTKPIVGNRWSPCLQTLEGHKGVIKSLAFSADGSTLASASVDKTIKVWDTMTGQCLRTLKGHMKPVKSVAFSRNKDILASASEDGLVKLWNTTKGHCLKTYQGYDGWVMAVTLSQDDTKVALASDRRTLELWDTTTDQYTQYFEGSSAGRTVYSMAFSANGTRLAMATTSREIILFDTFTGLLIKKIIFPRDYNRSPTGYVQSMAFSGDGTHIVTGSFDGIIRVWNTATGQCLWAAKNKSCKFVTFSHNGTQITSTDWYSLTIKIWDATTGVIIYKLESHGSPASSMAFSGDDTQFASASPDRTVKLWDLTAQHGTQPISPKATISVAQLTLTSSQDKSARENLMGPHESQPRVSSNLGHADDQLNDDKGMGIHEFHNTYAKSVAFSVTGEQLASMSSDEVKLWDAKTGRLLQSFPVNGYSNYAVAFSGCKLLFARANGKNAEIFDVSTSLRLHVLEGHNYDPRALAFSPDGTTLATTSHDETVRLWDTSTGCCKVVFGIGQGLSYLKFSETGSHLETKIGAIDLDIQMPVTATSLASLTPTLGPLNLRGYTVKRRGQWIKKNRQVILWLPSEYRTSTFDVNGSAIALACYSGRIVLLRFSQVVSSL